MNYSDFLSNIENEKGFKIKVKGISVGKPNEFNYSLMIIKKGIINYLINQKSFLQTIQENQELIDYQIIVKSSAKTKYVDVTNQQMIKDKVLRLFPVTEGGIKITNQNADNVPNVPEQSIIIKDDIRDKTISDIANFDINHYITLFNDKIKDFQI